MSRARWGFHNWQGWMQTCRAAAKLPLQYSRAFQKLPVVTMTVRTDVVPAWHLYPIRLNLESLPAGRGRNLSSAAGRKYRRQRSLHSGSSASILSRPFSVASAKGTSPVAEDAYERLISLPMFHSMTAQDVDDVIRAVRKVLVHYAEKAEPGPAFASMRSERERSSNSSCPESPEWAKYRALIVGCGSIGRRHARNLYSLGLRQLGFCDTSPEALQQCSEDVKGETLLGLRRSAANIPA